MKARFTPQLVLAAILIFLLCLSIACDTAPQPHPDVPEEASLSLFDVNPITLDPAIAASDTTLTYAVEIFSGLVAFDPDLNLTPDIAERWAVNDDGVTYTFHLRHNVSFHDGRQVTANDFKYSMERACDPSTASQTAETYLGDIIGATEKLSGKADGIQGLKVIDEYTLELTIDAPKEYFPSKLAHPVAFVVDRANVEAAADWWRAPNGTGPFRLMEWEQNDYIILERNALYYLTPPATDYIVYKLWAGVPFRMYERGEIDVTGVGIGDIERVLDPSNPLNQELVITPELSLYMIGFNSTEPPFDDAMVRQAFCHAIDKNKITSLTLKGLVNAAEGILPPGMPGYNPNLQGLPYDVARARRLLTESTYGDAANLPPITLTSPGRGIASSIQAALVDMWRRNLGVEVDIRQLEPEKFPYLLMGEKDQLFTLGWGADYPDPQNFLDVLFHTGSENNMGEYSNLEADGLLQQARAEGDEETRMNLYRQAEQLLVDDAACLPLYFDVSYTLVKPYVKNLPLTPLWIPRLKHVTVEPH